MGGWAQRHEAAQDSGSVWEVLLHPSVSVVRASLESDCDWSAYALGDIEPPLVAHAHIALAARDGRVRSAVLVFAPPAFTSVVTFGEPAGVAAVLAAMPLPPTASLSVRPTHRVAIESWFDASEWASMRRLGVGPRSFAPPLIEVATRRLTTADVIQLERLYAARDYVAPFNAAMVDEGVYHGVFDGDELVAAAGTHVVARVSRVAVLGNVYSRPAWRGRGFARAVTGAVVRDLLAEGCRRVALTVHHDNAAALAVYRRLGFSISCSHWNAATATRRNAHG